MNQTMNGAKESRRDTLREVIPTLQLNLYQHHYHQQDGAFIHWTILARHLLDDNLPGRLIRLYRMVPNSINDFWLLGYLRDNVFQEPRGETVQVLSERC